jgi:hypothetical protein
MPDYQYLTQDELLNFAQQRNQLTDEARLELDSELGRRRIGAIEVAHYARESIAQQKADERRIKRSRNFYETRNKRFIGKKNRKLDPRFRVDEFDTTLWFVIWIPVVPLGSYRVRRRFRRLWNPCRSRRLHILETRPRDWEQILLTWMKTATALFVLCLAVFAARALHL